MTTNKNKVPLKQWRKWSETAKKVFNRMYGFYRKNFAVISHPMHDKPQAEHWETLCWNTAWLSADAVDDEMPKHIVVDINMKTGEVVKRRKVK